MRVRRIVDLSVPVGPATPVYPGDPQARLTPHATLQRDGYNLLELHFGSQTGTHVDAPYHVRADGTRVDALDLALCTGPATVLDLRGLPPRTPITPDRCWIALDRRYLPSESAESVKAGIEDIFDVLGNRDPDFRASIVEDKDFPPFLCDEREEVVSLMRRARKKVLGDDKKPRAWRFGVDGTFLHARGMPCVGLGPGIEAFAHTPHDHVPVDQLISACEVYAEFMRLAAA